MSTKYKVRVQSPVPYEFWEAETDTYEELVDAAAELNDLKAQAGGDVTPAQGVANVKSAFGKTTTISGGGGAFGKPAGSQGKQESAPDKRELGKHEGYTITINNGKFGYYANAYNYDSKDKLPNKNLPKGADPASFTLEQAIELWSE